MRNSTDPISPIKGNADWGQVHFPFSVLAVRGVWTTRTTGAPPRRNSTRRRDRPSHDMRLVRRAGRSDDFALTASITDYAAVRGGVCVRHDNSRMLYLEADASGVLVTPSLIALQAAPCKSLHCAQGLSYRVAGSRGSPQLRVLPFTDPLFVRELLPQ
jgi:hypothetical protein